MAGKTKSSRTPSWPQQLSTAAPSPTLLDEVAWWQTDDFWLYALCAAVAYMRAAANRAGVPARQACQELTQPPIQPLG